MPILVARVWSMGAGRNIELKGLKVCHNLKQDLIVCSIS